jgi:hypothetical protein
MIVKHSLDFLGGLIAEYLTKPIHGYEPTITTNVELLRRSLRIGDVLLVEGNTRVATAIKYLTQSTWSHAALYVGPIADRCEPTGEFHLLIEADINAGVICVPLSKYENSHTRICRPVGLDECGCKKVRDYAIDRLGLKYDVKNIIDLMRYLLPTPPVPSRFRRRMIALGSGSPTQAICSTLIAQAFQSVRYPILPVVERIYDSDSLVSGKRAWHEILHIRHHSLFTPRDFDISPYFAIVKPAIAMGFDHSVLEWAEKQHSKGDFIGRGLDRLNKKAESLKVR